MLQKYKDLTIDNVDENDDTKGRVVDVTWSTSDGGWQAVVEWDNDKDDRTVYPEKELRGILQSFKMKGKRKKIENRTKEIRDNVSKALGIQSKHSMTTSLFTTFYGTNIVYTYADADLGADVSGRSRYGGVIMLNGAAIAWISTLS